MQGAIYVTDNGAQSWKAAVQETVDATLNRTVSSGKWTSATVASQEQRWTHTSLHVVNTLAAHTQERVKQSYQPSRKERHEEEPCCLVSRLTFISGASYHEGTFSQIVRSRVGDCIMFSPGSQQ